MKVHVSHVGPLDTLRLKLDKPKGNVLDGPLVAELTEALERGAADPSLRAILLEAAGNDFCFGASVEDHLPGQVKAMLQGLHRLVRAMVEAPVPVLVAVQGRCLGGGYELALAGSRIFATADATIGQPEVKLGLFAPAATALLPHRVGHARAEELLLSGRSLKGVEALSLGLIDELATEHTPSALALAWVEHSLLPLSKSGLRFACRAARLRRAAAVREDLAALERLYLDELMTTPDATEGLHAFLEKRQPRWTAGAAK